MKTAALAALTILLACVAQGETINFDGPGFTNFVQVTNQYPHVTFSSIGGDVVLITAQNPPYGGSTPNLICTGTANPGAARTIDCTHSLILDFDTPISDLSFTTYGNQNPAPDQFALINFFFSSGAPLLNIPLNVSHTQHCLVALDCVGDPQDFNLSGIVRVVIHDNTDPAGTAYDDFNFFVPGDSGGGTPQVPEPVTGMLVGLGAVTLGMIKRKTSK